jgi:hypothetical protein
VVNASTFLNYLAEHSPIQRDIQDASIGQFRLVKGDLVNYDVAMLKEVWKNKAFRDHFIAEANKATSAQSPDVSKIVEQPAATPLNCQKRQRKVLLLLRKKLSEPTKKELTLDHMDLRLSYCLFFLTLFRLRL